VLIFLLLKYLFRFLMVSLSFAHGKNAMKLWNLLFDRWLDYSFFGQPLSGLKIFPCKVPLRKVCIFKKCCSEQFIEEYVAP